MDSSKSAGDKESGNLLDYLEVTTGPDPEYSVIWLHGLGADGYDFEPIVPYLGIDPGKSVRFIFPHALMRPVTINGGAVMRAWYDITEISARGQDEAGVRHSAVSIRDLLGLEISRGIPASKIILAGFSQGGAMALHVGLRYPQTLAGIMVLSGYLLFPERLEDERTEANSRTPLFSGHGTQDPVVPFMLGEAVRSVLAAGQWPLESHDYPIPHAVSPEEIVDIGHWLNARLS